MAPPPPQYSYQEINVASLAGLAPHIQINSQVCLLGFKTVREETEVRERSCPFSAVIVERK